MSKAPAYLALLLYCSCGLGAGEPPKATDGGRRPAARRAIPTRDVVLGFVVAREFTELRAPPNVFKLAGWTSSSHWTKLVMLADEGARVKKGDVVARFSFGHTRALDRVKDRIRQAEAAQKASAIAEDKALATLLNERRQRVLAATTARLDTLKEAVISKRQLLLYRIAEKRARFEVEAITSRIAAQKKSLRAERDYHVHKVALEKSNIGRYDRQKARYALHAPHAGVVRHAYMRRRRRKVKKGDGMPAGTPVVLLAKDERLAVRCFVPEHRLGDVSIGQHVVVMGNRSTSKYIATVTAIERFPQELGFLLENSDLPNAHAKAFVVIAELPKGTRLAAGHEVRIRIGANGKGGQR